MKGKDNTLYCSFCAKCQTEVLTLIAGPTVFICDECVDLAVDIVNEARSARSRTAEVIAATIGWEGPLP